MGPDEFGYAKRTMVDTRREITSEMCQYLVGQATYSPKYRPALKVDATRFRGDRRIIKTIAPASYWLEAAQACHGRSPDCFLPKPLAA